MEVCACTPHPRSGRYRQPSKFQIDLDLSPRKRWQHIIPQFLHQIKRFKAYIEEISREDFGKFYPVLSVLARYVGACLQRFSAGDVVRFIASATYQLNTTPEISEELAGIAELTASHGMNYSDWYGSATKYKTTRFA
jgi:hypothetical protein